MFYLLLLLFSIMNGLVILSFFTICKGKYDFVWINYVVWMNLDVYIAVLNGLKVKEHNKM